MFQGVSLSRIFKSDQGRLNDFGVGFGAWQQGCRVDVECGLNKLKYSFFPGIIIIVFSKDTSKHHVTSTSRGKSPLDYIQIKQFSSYYSPWF